MTTMITEVYEALTAAGSPEDKAKAAAESIAEQDTRFDRVEGDLRIMNAKLDSLEKQLDLIKWMVGGTFFGIVALLIKSFFA